MTHRVFYIITSLNPCCKYPCKIVVIRLNSNNEWKIFQNAYMAFLETPSQSSDNLECGTLGTPIVAQQVENQTSIHKDADQIPGPAQWLKGSGIAVAVVWLAATAQIRPLAWELPYAVGEALQRPKQNKTKTNMRSLRFHKAWKGLLLVQCQRD